MALVPLFLHVDHLRLVSTISMQQYHARVMDKMRNTRLDHFLVCRFDGKLNYVALTIDNINTLYNSGEKQKQVQHHQGE